MTEDISKGLTSRAIMVWRFEDAPEEYRSLSTSGGDEDWLAVVPQSVLDSEYGYIGWLQPHGPFGICDVQAHPIGDAVVYIGSHS